MLDKLSKVDSYSDKVTDSVALKEAIGSLDGKERRLIELRYFEDKTQTEIAKLLGISQVQVSRLEKKILMKMKTHLA